MFYIDFDTLYDTGKLKKDILTSFASTIGNLKNLDPNLVLEEIKQSFNSSLVNFQSLASGLASRYNINEAILQKKLQDLILTNGKSYVFPDALQFLKKLKEEGEKVCILTSSNNLEQQVRKILGSRILPFVTEVHYTTKPISESNIIYETRIIIDDSPNEINNFHIAGAPLDNIHRIIKPSNKKRTDATMTLSVPTHTSFNEIDIKKDSTYLIDLDNTLYQTGQLTPDILHAFANVIGNAINRNPDLVLNEITNSFNSSVANFKSLAFGLATKYHIGNNILQSELNNIIFTKGKSYVFPDALQFLKELQKVGANSCILTYVANSQNLEQQALKLLGSGILPYVTGVYNTTRSKAELGINYKTSTIIGNNLDDLKDFKNAGADAIIMNKTSSTQKSYPNIPTYTSFDEIDIEKLR